MQKKLPWIILIWLLAMLFPLAGFMKLWPVSDHWFSVLTGFEALHITMHLLIYAGLMVLILMWAHWRITPRTVIGLLLLTVAVGFVQESIQAWAAGYPALTGAEYFDILVDLIGASFGLLFSTRLKAARPTQRGS
jgi:hypothetical protein